MTREIRFFLFIFLAILFLLVSPLVIFYSQGYRFDFEAKKVTRTGAFYFKTWPKSAQIFLNNQFKKKTDFLSGEVLIENLLPKKYEVEIKKLGFHPWKKTLEIKEMQATDAKNIILFPENPSFELLDKNVAESIMSLISKVKDIKISPDQKKLVYFSDNEIWILFLEKVFEQPPKEKGERLFLIRFSEKIGDVFWLSSHYLIFNIENKLKIIETDDRDRINIIDLAEIKIDKIFFNQNDKKLYILNEGNLYSSEKLLP